MIIICKLVGDIKTTVLDTKIFKILVGTNISTITSNKDLCLVIGFGYYEPLHTKLTSDNIWEWLNSERLVLNIGSTIEFDGNIYTIEPDQESVLKLKHNLETAITLENI